MMDRPLLKLVMIVSVIATINCVARADDIELGIYQQDPGVSSRRGEISGLIKAHIDVLLKNDPTTVADARDWLITNASGPRQANGTATQASNAFKDLYTDELNKLLLPLTDSKQPERVRLNAAIVEYRVSLDAPNVNLLPSVLNSLNDGNGAPVYWAEQAARVVLQEGISRIGFAQDRDKLLNAMVDAAIPFGQSYGVSDPVAGQILEKTYDALKVDKVDLALLANNPEAPAIVKSSVTALLRLKQSRLNIYLNQNDSPSQPIMDTYALLYIQNDKEWHLLDKTPLQQQIVQSAYDLIRLASQQAIAQLARNQKKSVAGAAFNDLMDTVGREAQNLHDIATNLIQDSDVAAAVQKVKSLTKLSSAPEIEAAVQQLLPALQKRYPTLHPPEVYSTTSH